MADENYIDRMVAERAELSGRILKLGTFIISNPAFESLPHVKQSLLLQQHSYMCQYLTVLDMRIEVEKQG